jgi:hypothetical protein
LVDLVQLSMKPLQLAVGHWCPSIDAVRVAADGNWLLMDSIAGTGLYWGVPAGAPSLGLLSGTLAAGWVLCSLSIGGKVL